MLGLSPGRIEADQPAGRNSSQIQRNQRQMPEGSPDPSLALPPARRGHDRNRRPEQPAPEVQASDQIDVLHNREVRIAPERLEYVPADEERLVTVRKGQ